MVIDCFMHEVPCPACGALNNAHGDGQGNVPADDDYAICWHCHTVSVYTDAGRAQRLLTVEEHREAMANPEVRQALGLMRESYRPHQAIAVLGELSR